MCDKSELTLSSCSQNADQCVMPESTSAKRLFVMCSMPGMGIANGSTIECQDGFFSHASFKKGDAVSLQKPTPMLGRDFTTKTSVSTSSAVFLFTCPSGAAMIESKSTSLFCWRCICVFSSNVGLNASPSSMKTGSEKCSTVFFIASVSGAAMIESTSSNLVKLCWRHVGNKSSKFEWNPGMPTSTPKSVVKLTTLSNDSLKSSCLNSSMML